MKKWKDRLFSISLLLIMPVLGAYILLQGPSDTNMINIGLFMIFLFPVLMSIDVLMSKKKGRI